jgi:hypothetical protein
MHNPFELIAARLSNLEALTLEVLACLQTLAPTPPVAPRIKRGANCYERQANPLARQNDATSTNGSVGKNLPRSSKATR